MAYIFDANETPSTNSLAMFQFKALLKTAGWTVPLSSDGTTNISGDQITTGATGTGGMNNPNAWFVLQQPTAVDGYSRQLLFFRDTSGTTLGINWWIQYSINAGFTGGGATTAPTASDAQNLLGTSATGAALFTTGGSFRWQIIADNTSAYSFAAFAYPIGGGQASTIMMSDRMVAGSFPAQDNDPYIWFFSGYSTNHALAYNTGSGNSASISADCCMTQAAFNATNGVPSAWVKYGFGGQSFVTCPALFYSQFYTSTPYSLAPFGLGSNPHSGNDDLFPLLWGRTAAAGGLVGYKGTSTLMQWCGAQRSTADTITVSTSSDHIVVNGAVIFPWNGSNPLI